jgi:Family of unknown function (DUF6069)
MSITLSTMFERIVALARLDFSPRHQQPSWWRVALATVASIVGSLAVDALLVAVGEHVLHVSSGYQHFHLSDYGKLTVIGVIIACVAWPITTRITSHPRWMFFRMAIAVTLVLWLPDLYILYRGQPARAVAVLMLMHLAIALVTYNLLVHLAPVHPARPESRRAPAHGDGHDSIRQYASHADEYDGYDRRGQRQGHPDERYGLPHEHYDRRDQFGDYRGDPNRSSQY